MREWARIEDREGRLHQGPMFWQMGLLDCRQRMSFYVLEALGDIPR